MLSEAVADRPFHVGLEVEIQAGLKKYREDSLSKEASQIAYHIGRVISKDEYQEEEELQFRF